MRQVVMTEWVTGPDGQRMPRLTGEARAQALDKARRLTRERSELLRAVKSGRVAPEAVLMRRDEAARGIRVERWVREWPGYGRAKAERLMRDLGISPCKHVGGLGCRQRARLLDWLAENPPKAPRKPERA